MGSKKCQTVGCTSWSFGNTGLCAAHQIGKANAVIEPKPRRGSDEVEDEKARRASESLLDSFGSIKGFVRSNSGTKLTNESEAVQQTPSHTSSIL